ncbi:hypothetical protein SEA_GHOBES_34 [Gordonia phage Ghobes]|uniref:Uncharacterized protein n=1 Tax=Gordonia phage Ghobes TaxID=1887647 RepID=A0A1B3B091_9CAUD|nr:hypothetical protein KCH37_gp34 [Gordonia phage Ghobes]AOE44386.1 hypothetical protein SEA_GHOBES_34 [Gordonia phage Ghobes]
MKLTDVARPHDRFTTRGDPDYEFDLRQPTKHEPYCPQCFLYHAGECS